MTSATARVRRHRERQRDGKAVLPVTVDLDRVRDVLLDAGLLRQWDDGDRTAIAEALSKAVELWAAAEERRRL